MTLADPFRSRHVSRSDPLTFKTFKLINVRFVTRNRTMVIAKIPYYPFLQYCQSNSTHNIIVTDVNSAVARIQYFQGVGFVGKGGKI